MYCNGVNITEKDLSMEHARISLVSSLLRGIINNIIIIENDICESMKSSSSAYLNAKIIEEGIRSWKQRV